MDLRQTINTIIIIFPIRDILINDLTINFFSYDKEFTFATSNLQRKYYYYLFYRLRN